MYEEEPSQEEKEVVICHGEDRGPVLSLLFVGYLSCTDRKKNNRVCCGVLLCVLTVSG